MKRLLCCVAALWAATLFLYPFAAKTHAATPLNDDLVVKSIQALSEQRSERDTKTNEFELTRFRPDEYHRVHAKFRQTVDGIPVWGGEAIVHLREDGSL